MSSSDKAPGAYRERLRNGTGSNGRRAASFLSLCFALAFGPAAAHAVAEDSVTPRPAPVRLTTDGLFKRDPIVDTEGRRIVYSVQENPSFMALTALELASGRTSRIHPQATQPQYGASFSRDGQRYVYLQTRGNLDITLMFRTVGGDQAAALFTRVASLSIAPDGKSVVCSHAERGRQRILWMDTSGERRRVLTATEGFNVDPVISPDGKSVAFASSRDGDLEIYLMQVDGSGIERLTHSSARDMRPAWSPDGKRIAFTSAREGNPDIYLMHRDGTGVRRLTHAAESDDFPTWYPDGMHLAFVGERKGRFDLYRLALRDRTSRPPERAGAR